MRVVLDTSIFVSAFRSQFGASNAVLVAVARNMFIAVASTPLFLEYESVLKRPEQRIVSGLTEVDIDVFLAEFATLVEAVDVHFKWRPILPDPADDMVLEAAMNGNAEAIVSFNQKDFRLAETRFGLQILTPQQFLMEIM